jgi:phage gp29-like protein
MKNRDYLTKELATRDKSINYNLIANQYLANPDPILKKQGRDISIYSAVLGDDRVGGCVKSRKAGIKKLQWGIDRGKSKSRQAVIIEKCFNNLKIRQIISSILNAPLFGYAVLEINWQFIDGYYLPRKVQEKPQEWFLFNSANELMLKTKEKVEPLPEKKFLLVQHEDTFVNPYGFPELSRCFWPVAFKKGGLKFWLMFCEKYGTPFIVGKQPRGAGKDETDKMLETLENMIQDAVAVIPDDASVEIMEASGKSASSEIFKAFIDECKSQISIALLGQNLTTEVTGGSYAAAQSHLSVRQDIMDEDKTLVEDTFNTLIDYIYQLNFGDAERPKFSMWADEDVDTALAERDDKLTTAMEKSGLKLSKKYYQKNYGLEDEDILENKDAEPTEFSESKPHGAGQDEIDETINNLSKEDLQKEMEGILKPIIDLINDGNSYEEIMENLAKTFPEMESDSLLKMLERAIFVSELWGIMNAKS